MDADEIWSLAVNITEAVAQAVLRPNECGDRYSGYDELLKAVLQEINRHEQEKRKDGA